MMKSTTPGFTKGLSVPELRIALAKANNRHDFVRVTQIKNAIAARLSSRKTA